MNHLRTISAHPRVVRARGLVTDLPDLEQPARHLRRGLGRRTLAAARAECAFCTSLAAPFDADDPCGDVTARLVTRRKDT